MDIVFLPPSKIKVKDGLDRYRQELGDLNALADSMRRTRQIVPIIVTRDHCLVDGGRRLAACLLNDTDVKCVYEDVVDIAELRELEIESNLHRLPYTPAEYALAVDDLHKLKQKRHGTATSGIEGGWTLDDTAKLLGKTRGSVIGELDRAEMIKLFPQLKGAKKKSEITKAAKGLIKLNKVLAGTIEAQQNIEDAKEIFQLIQGDAVEHMQSLSDESIDIICTDPIYGIDADKLAIGIGGKTGGKSTAGYEIIDDRQASTMYYYILAQESFRFCHNESQGYVFVAPEHFHSVRHMFLNAGWAAHIKPIIWVKRTTGQCNVPSAWPASCYEMVLYIRRANARLVKEGQPDWVQCDPVTESERTNQYEKPVDLLIDLLSRVTIPGQILYDPFMGSGAIIEVATRLSLRSIGVDIDTNSYANATVRLSKVWEEVIKDAKQ